MGKIYEATDFKILGIRQRTLITEKWGTNNMNPMIASAYSLERISRLNYRK